jgi:hypothetical protein
MAISDKQFEMLRKDVSGLSTSLQGLQDSWVKTPPTKVWLISITVPVIALIVAICAGVLPHLEKHIDDQIQIKLSDGLKEPSTRIGKLEQNISEIQGELKVFAPLITESLGKRIKSSLQLNPQQFKESVPELSKIITAAREAKISIDLELLLILGSVYLTFHLNKMKKPQSGMPLRISLITARH